MRMEQASYGKMWRSFSSYHMSVGLPLVQKAVNVRKLHVDYQRKGVPLRHTSLERKKKVKG